MGDSTRDNPLNEYIATSDVQKRSKTSLIEIGPVHDNRSGQKPLDISSRDGVQSRAYSLHQSLAAPSPALPEQLLELGEGLLNRVNGRGVVHEHKAPRLDPP